MSEAAPVAPPAQDERLAGPAHRDISSDVPWPRSVSSPEDRILETRSPSNPAWLKARPGCEEPVADSLAANLGLDR
jgi:hypothetical protein